MKESDNWPPGYLQSVEAFLAEDHLRVGGEDSCLAGFESDLFFPLQRRREWEAMVRIVRGLHSKQLPLTVMEIGADKGGGVYQWLKCLPNVARMIVCEPRGMPYAKALEKAFPKVKFLWLADSSYVPRTFHRVENWIGDIPIDVLFIDGDKLEGVGDFDAYLPMMSPGGVVFIHDINGDPPRLSFEAITRRGYRHEVIHDTSESKEAMAREKLGIPLANPHEGWLRHWKGRSCGVGVIYLT